MFRQKAATPIIAIGMNALRLPGFPETLGYGNVINTAVGGFSGEQFGAMPDPCMQPTLSTSSYATALGILQCPGQWVYTTSRSWGLNRKRA